MFVHIDNYDTLLVLRQDGKIKTLPEAQTLDLLNLLPTVECLSPMKSMDTKALSMIIHVIV